MRTEGGHKCESSTLVLYSPKKYEVLYAEGYGDVGTLLVWCQCENWESNCTGCGRSVVYHPLKKKVKAVYSASWETHLRATGRHLPYGITQCYLPPDTSEHAPP